MAFDDFQRDFQRRFDEKMAAREMTLPAARRAIRSCANAIRAIHRHETARAQDLPGASDFDGRRLGRMPQAIRANAYASPQRA